MSSRGFRLGALLLVATSIAALGASEVQAQRAVSRVWITGSSATGDAVVIDLVKEGQQPPACTLTYTPGVGESGASVRDALVPVHGMLCEFDSAASACKGFLHRHSHDATQFLASAPCAFECWVKNGSAWEPIDGQTIDGLRFTRAKTVSTSTNVGRTTFGPYDIDAATGLRAGRGIAELGGVAFVSVTDPGSPNNLLAAIDLPTGAVLNTAQQPVWMGRSMSFRGGTSDGRNLMFIHNGEWVVPIDATSALSTSGQVSYVWTIMADNGPQTLIGFIRVRRPLPTGRLVEDLAYNPSGNGGNGSLWLCSAEGLWEIDLSGNIRRSFFDSGYRFSGVAWDHASRTLWCSSEQPASEIVEVSPWTGRRTGRAIERHAWRDFGSALTWTAGGLDGRTCGSDLLVLGEYRMPNVMTGRRLRLWDTLPYREERAVRIGVDGGGVMRGDASVRIGMNSSFEIDLSGTAGAAWVALINFDTVATTAHPLPHPLSAVFSSLWELAVDVSAGALINVGPMSSGSPVSLPVAGLLPGEMTIQAVSLNSRAIGSGNPCGLGLPVEVSGTTKIRVEPPLVGCGVVASASGQNTYNGITSSGFFRVSNHTGQDIKALTIDGRVTASPLRFDTDQDGLVNRFDAGVSVLNGCRNTYRNGCDMLTGLVYVGTHTSPDCSGTPTGWIGTSGTATHPRDFQVLDFTFTDFNDGEVFEFDCDTDGLVWADGGAMVGMLFTATLADGTVCSGSLAADPFDPLTSTASF